MEEYVQQQAEFYSDRLTHDPPPDPAFASVYQPVTDYTEMAMDYKAPNAYQ
ncbi:Hypothetical predicted protein, partial [Xyrichtys novacula]